MGNAKLLLLLGNAETVEHLKAGASPEKIVAGWGPSLAAFQTTMQIPNCTPRRLLAMVLECNRSRERLFPNRLESARMSTQSAPTNREIQPVAVVRFGSLDLN